MSKKLNAKQTKLLKELKTEITELADEMASLSGQIRALYKKAKDGGLDQQVLRRVIQRDRKDRTQLALFDATVMDYENALGIKQGELPVKTNSIDEAEAILDGGGENVVRLRPEEVADTVAEAITEKIGEIVDPEDLNNGDDAVEPAAPGYQDKTERMTADEAREYFKTGTAGE